MSGKYINLNLPETKKEYKRTGVYYTIYGICEKNSIV